MVLLLALSYNAIAPSTVRSVVGEVLGVHPPGHFHLIKNLYLSSLSVPLEEIQLLVGVTKG